MAGAEGRWASLVDATFRGRTIEIDGVRIVLRHPDLDRTIWRPAVVLGEFDAEGRAPPISFPWTPREARKRLVSQEGAVEVESGDIVYVRTIVGVSFSTAYGEFDHPHNREAIGALLGVLRADGGESDVQTPLLFFGRETTLLSSAPGRRASDLRFGLIERLNGRCGFDIAEFLGRDESEWPEIPSHLTQSERRALRALVQGELTEEPHEVEFGYWMARAEAEATLLPAGLRAAARANSDRASGAKGGAQIRARSQALWAAEGLALAQRIRAERPTLGSKALASAMMNHVDLPDAAPDHEGLRSRIRSWEQSGQLQKAVKATT